MKKIIAVLMVVALLAACSVLAFADGDEEVITGGCYRFKVLNDEEASIVGFFGDGGYLHLDSSIGHRYITSVGTSAFEFNTNLINIRLNSRVKEIVFSHQYVTQMHGFYLVKEKKSMRFDIVSFKTSAADRQYIASMNLPQDTPVELRCRYYCEQSEEEPFYSDYSEVLTFGTKEIDGRKESVAEKSNDASDEKTNEESAVKEESKSEKKCSVCGICPVQPLGICLFIWIAIIVAVIIVVIVIILAVNKKKSNK